MPTTVKSSQWASDTTDVDCQMMSRALALAARGTGLVSPGPLVGCVILAADGSVAGEGFYVYEKLKHAETIALEQAGSRSNGGTAYVSLEPHAHHGRTPPCSDALITAGIRRVVAPVEDPNPRVSGKGFEHLRAAGLEVVSDLMSDEARRLNEKYFHFMKTGRPFVHLKLATSLDGKIATHKGDSRWITGEESRARVQELRHESDAILVGAGTAVSDNPLLTDRSGLARRRPLVRVILDEDLKVSSESQLVLTASDAPVLIFAGANADEAKTSQLSARGVEMICDSTNGRDLKSVLATLGSREIQSVLVEGGAGIASALLEAELVDKVTFFIAPRIIGGREAPNAVGGHGAERITDAIDLEDVEVSQRGSDYEITGYPKKRMKHEG
jgi:diaminohydroxyphosphoribosylaminopyrimidine deaminase/5-amino-6-(5-phosphoribosylamino)uracil reductase